MEVVGASGRTLGCSGAWYRSWGGVVTHGGQPRPNHCFVMDARRERCPFPLIMAGVARYGRASSSLSGFLVMAVLARHWPGLLVIGRASSSWPGKVPATS